MSRIFNKKKLNTWDNRSIFHYAGSVKEGTEIFYGSGQHTAVRASVYERMLKHFEGRTVDCGTSRTNPQLDSLGKWIQENVIKRSLASYVGAILVSEDYARKRGSKIEFLGGKGNAGKR
jgi:hypothetical protein